MNDFLDNLTGYANDLGSLYQHFASSNRVAPPVPAAPTRQAPIDNKKWFLIGGAVLAVVVVVAFLFKK